MSTELDFAFATLKNHKISKEDVAKELAVTPGYLSKMISGEKKFSPAKVRLFNRAYGHIIKIEENTFNSETSGQEGQASLQSIAKGQQAILQALKRIEEKLGTADPEEMGTPLNDEYKKSLKTGTSAGKRKQNSQKSSHR